MSSEAKRVKIITLIEMLLGLVLIVAGAVLAAMGAATAASYVLCGEGATTLLFGARGALIANVPARIGRLATLAVVALLVQAACVAAVIVLVGPSKVAEEPLATCLAVVPLIATLAVALLSRGMAKRAER